MDCVLNSGLVGDTRTSWGYADFCLIQKWIWDDSGSGADENVSFWQVHPENGYYPLGDTACKNWSRCKSMIRVKDLSVEQNALRQDGFLNV